MSEPRYTVVIQWSEEDQVYVVSLPEWGGCKTHGSTYEEAARHAHEVLELLIKNHEASKEGPLPEPKLFQFPGVEAADLEKPGTPPVDAAGAGVAR